MAQVNTMAEGSARLNPCSPQNLTKWHAARVQRTWLFKGPDAAKIPGIDADQVSYAITLRRQMATRLLAEAPEPVGALYFSDDWDRNNQWTTIRTALKREITRCVRADKRLAAKKAVAA